MSAIIKGASRRMPIDSDYAVEGEFERLEEAVSRLPFGNPAIEFARTHHRGQAEGRAFTALGAPMFCAPLVERRRLRVLPRGHCPTSLCACVGASCRQSKWTR